MIQHPPLTEGVYYILLSLYEPRHGYGIIQLTEQLTNDRVKLGAGTIYGAIKTLLDKGWIKPVDDDGRKKEYIITSTGKEMIEYEILRLKELYDNGIRITRGDND
ncbi:PadR family transcriptional regulator [Ureibacillus manganicus]|uniref:PadR family transcriptional regulator n=1 Tax=Ureibacillus manganicus DSM 26584 TaxID=1384049 RepID=A0A0A3I518_9BACL|nr:helix-turn-helix transcriptional regulator [Ureibacillus manganicus]KGR77763.1 PadR family transcriptional regulator [Ureibacillus manganicus DSM 26584]